MPEDLPPTLERMETMLRHCRRRIVLGRLKTCLHEGFRAWLGWLPGIAAAFLILRVLAWAFAAPAPGIPQLTVVITVVGAVFLVRALWLRGSVRIVDAAEHLDLAQSNHNRIATAMSLLQSGDESPFARAAIRDGWETLDRLKSADPQVERTPVSWQRTGLHLATAAVLALGGVLIVPKHGVERNMTDLQTTEPIGRSLFPGVPDVTGETPEGTITPAESMPHEPMAARSRTAAEIKHGERPEASAGAPSKGSMASPASAESCGSQTASSSNGGANGNGAKSEPENNEPSQAPKPRDAKRQTAGQPKPKPQEEKKGGSISARGSSGAGSNQTAQNESPNDVKAKSDDSDDFQNEEEPDEDMDPDKQRLGAQPALKNRSSKVSRELSLMTGLTLSNKQNRGRGGPGGQKKSRGTATMIMGVPIPGFVRGRLLPGPTKSTQEEIEPSPVEGKHATATDLPQANPEEEPQERYHPAVNNSERARDYLIQSHNKHDNTLNRADADK
jgi:hypothetical protein